MFSDSDEEMESFRIAVGLQEMSTPPVPQTTLTDQIITDNEIKPIIKKSYVKALERFYERFFLSDMYSHFVETGKMPLASDNPLLDRVVERSIDRIVSKPPFMLMTVNPRTDDYKLLKKSVDKFVKRKIVEKYAYCYEIRQKPDKGLHVHILLKYDCKPYEFRRAAKNTFKKVCDSNNPNILNFKFVEEKNLLQKYNYIKGIKSEKKKSGVNATEEWRKANNIEALFESIPHLPCRDAQESIDSNTVEITPLN